MTYLDSFISELLKNKQLAYELFVNIYNNISLVFFYNNERKIAFNKNNVNYNEDKDEKKLNNLCNLFKNEINNLIKNHISYNYIKDNCIKILENKLSINNKLNEKDINILKLHWLLNNIDVNLENYIKEYFNNQKIIIKVTSEWR